MLSSMQVNCVLPLGSKYFYRPQRSCEGYVFTRVCDSVHRGRCVLSQHALQVVSKHALQQGGACSWRGAYLGRCLLHGGCLLRGVCSWGVWRPPLPESRRLLLPTGMHSCVPLICFFAQKIKLLSLADWTPTFLFTREALQAKSVLSNKPPS